MGALRVFGVDPGLTRCGVGVVDGPPAQPVLVDQAVITTPRLAPIERRLDALFDALTDLLALHRPDVVACERVLFSSNARTAMAVGQAAGVALLAAARSGIGVVAYSPNEVKLTVTGDGAASKDAVARLVGAHLRLEVAPHPADVSDALAVALCHLTHARLAALTGVSGGGA